MFQRYDYGMRELESLAIIVPTFNRLEFLVETVDSLLNQSYENLEIFIVNDGSTDKTTDYFKDLVKQDSRVRVFSSEENLGESSAINLAWPSVRSRYVAIVNSDDPQIQNWAGLMMQATRTNQGFGFYYPNRIVIDQKGSHLRYEELYKWSFRTLYRKLIPIASAGMIIDRMQFPSNFVLRDETLRHPTDLFLVLRMAEHTSGFLVSEAVGTWREHKGNTSRNGFEFATSFEKNVSTWLDENLELISEFSSPGLSYSYIYLQYLNFLSDTCSIPKRFLTLFKETSFLRKLRIYPAMIFWLCYIIIGKSLKYPVSQCLKYRKLPINWINIKGKIKKLEA